MITMIINALFSFTLFITGGHLLDNKFKVHHYSDEDYKEIFFLQSPDSISKKCIKHSVVEKISYKNLHREGKNQRDYEISDPYPIQDKPQEDTFNSQRSY
ncbi:MAG: hypothetical protein HVK45_02405 [Pelagibacteraceae bacterium]|nr:hypothetical protein [Pelagibacteraceae bacterium]